MIEIEHRSIPQPPYRPRHAVGPWRPVVARTCIDCGLCVWVCPTNVFFFSPGRRHLAAPRAEACLGPEECGVCVPTCPADAITIEPNPNWACLGDDNWTNALVVSTWQAGTHGALSKEDPVSVGATDAGFDRMGLVAPEGAPILIPSDVVLRVPLHHRGRGFWIEFPIIGAALRPGTISAPTMLARAIAARALGTLTTITEGAPPPALMPYIDSLVLQLNGRFDNVDEATLARAPAIALRHGWTPGEDAHARFQAVYGLDDLKQQLHWLSAINPKALLIVEIGASADAAPLAAGIVHAGAHVIHLRGDPVGAPIAYAINPVHRYLQAEGLRDQVALIVGEARNPHDVLKAVALGADACAISAAELIALGCAPNVHMDGGLSCPPGIGAAETAFAALVDPAWAARCIVNLALAWAAEWRRALALLSLPGIRALRGRDDLLAWVGP